ncbi:MAG: hypothetical protein H6R19_212 [Proteobacteria bacterium]|nr:hypothetical protein [Pseudomonadota bacterium]
MPPITRFTLLALFLIAPAVQAERADRQKPIYIQSDKLSGDDRSKGIIYEGHVKLVQGTLELSADRILITQDADGFQKGVATGGKDGLARYRQKRDGKDEYFEGEAERIEYYGRTDKARLFIRAMARSGLNETRGQYIEYDGYAEQYLVTSGPNASIAKPGSEQVRTIFYPKATSPEAAASKPASGS